jgi:3-carboxy-cis,cis-muconate cycloisomerase
MRLAPRPRLRSHSIRLRWVQSLLRGGNPVIPWCGIFANPAQPAGVPAAIVHVGATSQNIIDTALMLLARRAGALVVENVLQAPDAAPTRTVTPRWLQEHWVSRRSRRRSVRSRGLVPRIGPFGGGNAISYITFLSNLAAQQALSPRCTRAGDCRRTCRRTPPRAPTRSLAYRPSWIGELAGALGVAAGAVAKPATDIVLMAATELGKASEDAPGGSSAMT